MNKTIQSNNNCSFIRPDRETFKFRYITPTQGEAVAVPLVQHPQCLESLAYSFFLYPAMNMAVPVLFWHLLSELAYATCTPAFRSCFPGLACKENRNRRTIFPFQIKDWRWLV